MVYTINLYIHAVTFEFCFRRADQAMGACPISTRTLCTPAIGSFISSGHNDVIEKRNICDNFFSSKFFLSECSPDQPAKLRTDATITATARTTEGSACTVSPTATSHAAATA